MDGWIFIPQQFPFRYWENFLLFQIQLNSTTFILFFLSKIFIKHVIVHYLNTDCWSLATIVNKDFAVKCIVCTHTDWLS